MTRKDFENYIHENKLESLFVRERDSLRGMEITLNYTPSDKYVHNGSYGCIHDEYGWHLTSLVDGERGDERGSIYSDNFATEEAALDELKRFVDFYKGYTLVHSYKDSVNEFLKKIAGKSIEPPFVYPFKHSKITYDISFSELDSLVKKYFPNLSFSYDYFDNDEQINIFAEHKKVLTVGTKGGKAVFWQFEDEKYIMFNKLDATFCAYECDESGIYTLYHNSLYILIKYGYDGSVLYAIDRGTFNDDALFFAPVFFSTFPVFDKNFSYKKHLGIANGTCTAIIERERGKVVHASKTDWGTVGRSE